MQQTTVLITLGLAMILWLTGKLRFDLVTVLALFALTLLKVIPVNDVFLGFSHPIVITVAAVLIISRAFHSSGTLDWLAGFLEALGSDTFSFVMGMAVFTALVSLFVNGILAMMVILPLAIQLSARRGIPASKVLMPVAFASILGGMGSLMGNVPNIVVSLYGAEAGSETFAVFDFFPLGGIITGLGVLVLGLAGLWFLPQRAKKHSGEEELAIEDYITEVKVLKDSLLAGSSLRKIMQNKEYDVTVIGLVREKLFLEVLDPDAELLPDDILVIEADSENLRAFMEYTRAKLIGGRKFHKDVSGARNISMREVVVIQDSPLLGKTAAQVNLRSRYGINLLAISRAGRKTIRRVSKVSFRVGDVLLIQGRTQILDEVISAMGCIPLTERSVPQVSAPKAAFCVVIFATAILASYLNLVPVHISFAVAAFILALGSAVPVRELYQKMDWSVLLLLAALIPVSKAFAQSGAAGSLANMWYNVAGGMPLWADMALLMALAMLFANLYNSAIAALILSPLALALAQVMYAPPQMLLIAVALGAASSFVNPKANPVNTIVMGPGAYHGLDYLKLGFLMQILVLAMAVPLLMWYWA